MKAIKDFDVSELKRQVAFFCREQLAPAKFWEGIEIWKINQLLKWFNGGSGEISIYPVRVVEMLKIGVATSKDFDSHQARRLRGVMTRDLIVEIHSDLDPSADMSCHSFRNFPVGSSGRIPFRGATLKKKCNTWRCSATMRRKFPHQKILICLMDICLCVDKVFSNEGNHAWMYNPVFACQSLNVSELSVCQLAFCLRNYLFIWFPRSTSKRNCQISQSRLQNPSVRVKTETLDRAIAQSGHRCELSQKEEFLSKRYASNTHMNDSEWIPFDLKFNSIMIVPSFRQNVHLPSTSHARQNGVIVALEFSLFIQWWEFRETMNRDRLIRWRNEVDDWESIMRNLLKSLPRDRCQWMPKEMRRSSTHEDLRPIGQSPSSSGALCWWLCSGLPGDPHQWRSMRRVRESLWIEEGRFEITS
jgi:hypothetical protein